MLYVVKGNLVKGNVPTIAFIMNRESEEFTVETFTDLSGGSYASAVKGKADPQQPDNDAIPSAVPFMYGNASVETVRGIIHLYKTEYGFDISTSGPSKVCYT